MTSKEALNILDFDLNHTHNAESEEALRLAIKALQDQLEVEQKTAWFKEALDNGWFDDMREPTSEERNSVNKYVESISKETGVKWDGTNNNIENMDLSTAESDSSTDSSTDHQSSIFDFLKSGAKSLVTEHPDLVGQIADSCTTNSSEEEAKEYIDSAITDGLKPIHDKHLTFFGKVAELCADCISRQAVLDMIDDINSIF